MYLLCLVLSLNLIFNTIGKEKRSSLHLASKAKWEEERGSAHFKMYCIIDIYIMMIAFPHYIILNMVESLGLILQSAVHW